MTVHLTIEAYGKCSPSSTGFDLDKGRATLGRAPSNDWVLDDPDHVISKLHCELKSDVDGVQVTDLSSNGLFINGSFTPLGRNNTEILKTGDRIQIGEYVIRVDIDAPAEDDFLGSPFGQSGSEDLTEVLAPADEDASGSPERPVLEESYGAPFGEAVSPVGSQDPLGLDEAPVDRMPGEPAFPDHLPLDEHFMAPPSFDAKQPEAGSVPEAAAESGAGGDEILPDDWDLDEMLGPQMSPETPAKQDRSTGTEALSFDDVLQPGPQPPAPISEADHEAPVAAPVSVKPAADAEYPGERLAQVTARSSAARESADAPESTGVGQGENGLFGVFLQNAGIDVEGKGLDPQRIAGQSGLLFRKMLDGLMLLLQARTVVKNEYQLERTFLRPVANNPIKSLPNVDEIIAILYRTHDESGVWLEPEAAVDEAIQDLKSHEIALLAGMNAAIEFFVSALAPDRFADHADPGRKKLLSFSALDKVRGWDRFEAEYAEVRRMLEEGLTGEARSVFERAYSREKQRLES